MLALCVSLVGLCTVTAVYCTAGNIYAQDSNLGAVTLVGDGKSINDITNCPGVVGMRNYTDQSATLRAGGQYALTFQVTTCAGGYVRKAYAFIDFNQNQVYDPEELLGEQDVTGQLAPFTANLQFVVPQTVVNGTTRMRVFVVEGGEVADPCLSFYFGGVKEFSINLSGLSASSCCLPTTYSSVATVMEGSQVDTVYAYQDWATQSYLERTETPGKDFSALLCLTSTQLCYGYSSTTCAKYGFVFPTQECPGSTASKFKFQFASVFTPGGTQMNVYSQTGTTISTTRLEQWCVINSWIPNSFYSSWDLRTPAASFFVVPPICATVKEISSFPAERRLL